MPTNATSIGRLRELAADALRDAPERRARRRAGDSGAMPVLVDEPLEQVLAEARRMLDRQADVLVEVEQLDAVPVDAGAAVSASRNPNCDAPVATMIRALPLVSMARRRACAACAAAADSSCPGRRRS